MPSARSRIMKLVLPGVFLLVLGIGNISVGTFKGEQYEQVLQELSTTEPGPSLANASPLRRIQLATQTASRLYQRQDKARAKRDFYRLVASGGKVFVIISLLFLSLGALRYVRLFRSLHEAKAEGPA